MKNWRTIRLDVDATIRDAMRAIDLGTVGLALICEDSDDLVGVVSDGDIRRGLLDELDMTDPVVKVVNRDPRTMPVDSGRAQLLEAMQRHNLTVMPLVDELGRVHDVRTLAQLLARPHFDNPVFIMAGGFGTRLHPLTADTPKPMLKIGDKPMLQHQVERFVHQGFRNLYISTHYLPEKVREHFGDGSEFGARIVYVHEDTPLGTGGALGLLPDDMPQSPLLMINGDVLTNIDFTGLLRHHERSGRIATMCVREYKYQVPYGVVQTLGDVVAGMTEKPVHQVHVNTGIYVLEPELVAAVDPGTRIDMPTLLERVVADGAEVGIYGAFDYWLDIGHMDDYERAQQDIEIVGYA